MYHAYRYVFHHAVFGVVNVARAVVDKAGEAVLDLAVVREAGGALLTGNILK